MVGRLLVGFVWLNLLFSVSWLVDFQWVRVAQSLVFCVLVGRLLVGFVWLNLQISVSCQLDFQWGSCFSIFSFLGHGWQTFSGVRVAQSLVFCVMVQTFSGVRVAQSLVFCVMVGSLLVGFVCLNLQFSVSWLVDFQWGSCGSIFSFLRYGWQTFSGVREAQSLVFCVKVGDFQWGSCGSIFSFLCHGWQTFSGVRVAQYLDFCVMIGGLLVGFVWLNLLFSVSWLVDFQWASCVSFYCFLCHGRQTFSGVRVAQSFVFCVMVGRFLVGFVWLNLLFSVSWLVDFQWVRVAQSLVFCVMVGRLLVGFVCLNLQFSVSWLVVFQWGSCGSIFSFLCHGRQTFSGVRVSQSLVFCVMVGRLLVGFVWLNLQISVSCQVDFQWGSCVSILSFLSWLVDFQWGSCGSIFSFLRHGWQTFSGVREAQFGRLLVGFVWLNLQFSVSWLVDFWGSCFSVSWWVRFLAQYLDFCVMIGRLLVGFVWLNLQFSVSWLVDFQWGSCVFSVSGGFVSQSFVQTSVSWLVDFQWGSCGSIFIVFCVMVGRLLVGFVWLNLCFCVIFQCVMVGGVRVAQSLVFCVMVGRLLVGSCGSIFSCHVRQTFSGVRVSQSFQSFSFLWSVFCVMVSSLLVGFVWLNLQFSVSWLVDFQWGSCVSIFSFLCYGKQTFSGVRVAQSLDFCVMLGRLLVGFVCLNLKFSVMVGRLSVGFVWLNLQFSASWLVDFQWGS